MNKFDQHIKDKLSQSQIPPIDAWKGIQEKLDETDRKKRSIPLFYWIGSTAACLVVGVSIFYFSQNENDVKNNSEIEVVKKSTPELPKESTKIIDSTEKNLKILRQSINSKLKKLIFIWQIEAENLKPKTFFNQFLEVIL